MLEVKELRENELSMCFEQNWKVNNKKESNRKCFEFTPDGSLCAERLFIVIVSVPNGGCVNEVNK
jgi:hypothetical protein